jgi:nucleoside-diphosphate-sugar epimerase
MESVQTILGSGGGIGIPLARELKKYAGTIRLVSRHPVKVNETDELFSADLTDPLQIDRAIEGSTIVYVTVGFRYSLKVWKKTWPPFIKQVIESCQKHQARLVFFDNVYMYSSTAVPFMTEEAIIDPPSRKGEIRQQVREMIIREVEKNRLTALIARAADFYGPENRNSILTLMVAENLLKGKKAQMFGDPSRIHTFTYTPDAAMATALLGNTPDAFGQEWHLPTTKEKITNRGWVEMIAAELGKEPKFQTIPAWMIKALGLVVPVMAEFPEMLYQYNRDYIFDSTRFEKRFDIRATPAADGIRRTIQALRTGSPSM